MQGIVDPVFFTGAIMLGDDDGGSGCKSHEETKNEI